MSTKKDETVQTQEALKCPKRTECYLIGVRLDNKYVKYCETCNNIINKK